MGILNTGPVSLQQIAMVFGGNIPYSLSEYYRGGGFVTNAPINSGIPTSGAISLGNFYNASGRVPVSVVILSNTSNYDAYTNRSGAYIAGVSDLTYTINSGVVISSSSTSSNAFTVSSSFLSTDTVSIVNNGTITGAGGAGGAGGIGNSQAPQPGSPGGAGGTGLYTERAVSVTNNGTIAGGGGGGGGGGASYYSGKEDDAKGGAGGGGGAGTVAGGGGAGGPAYGQELNQPGTAGTAGTSTTGGVTGRPGGGTGGNRAGFGGTGGNLGNAGGAGAAGNTNSTNRAGGAGGAAGYYIVGNSNVTWVANGTKLGQAG
jgi:hypothetical protein